MFDISYKKEELKIFDNLDFPRLISYPRTGSHWFRILMEAYLNEPSIVQSFFNPRPSNIWGFHIHHRYIAKPHPSEGPVFGLKNVIYLYRNPADTIFSIMKYEGNIPENWDGQKSIDLAEAFEKYKLEYYKHLQFYLNNQSNITNLHFIKYEEIRDNGAQTFQSCIKFLNRPWNPKRFDEIYKHCNKKLTKRLTPHDPAALNIEEITKKELVTAQRSAFKNIFLEDIKKTFDPLLVKK